MRISDWSSDVCTSDLSSVEDFRCDQKWPEYLEYCDQFYFAVPENFPQALIPPAQGLMVADGYGATVVRESADFALNAARRRALLLQFRSEEHTSELQSLMRISYAVFCLKKKKKYITSYTN